MVDKCDLDRAVWLNVVWGLLGDDEKEGQSNWWRKLPRPMIQRAMVLLGWLPEEGRTRLPMYVWAKART
jgi:hypothetical protein